MLLTSLCSSVIIPVTILTPLSFPSLLPQICIAEVEEIVEPGEIAPEDIHLPGVYVNRLLKCESLEKRIEKRTVQVRIYNLRVNFYKEKKITK